MCKNALGRYERGTGQLINPRKCSMLFALDAPYRSKKV
jgi:hypothetical protein